MSRHSWTNAERGVCRRRRNVTSVKRKMISRDKKRHRIGFRWIPRRRARVFKRQKEKEKKRELLVASCCRDEVARRLSPSRYTHRLSFLLRSIFCALRCCRLGARVRAERRPRNKRADVYDRRSIVNIYDDAAAPTIDVYVTDVQAANGWRPTAKIRADSRS